MAQTGAGICAIKRLLPVNRYVLLSKHKIEHKT